MDQKLRNKFNLLQPFDTYRTAKTLHWDNVSSEEKKYLVKKQIEVEKEIGMKIQDFIQW